MKLSARFQRQVFEVPVGRAVKIVEHYADVVVPAARRVRIARVGIKIIGVAVSRIAIIGKTSSAPITVRWVTIRWVAGLRITASTRIAIRITSASPPPNHELK